MRPASRVSSRAAVTVPVIVAAVALACAASGGAAPAPAPVTIGAVLSLTGGGDVYGPQQMKGAQLAVAQINAAGGVDGVPLRLVVRNDGSSPGAGVDVMRSLIEHDGVTAILGPTLSIVAVEADPVADRLATPVVAVSNTATGIVGDCSYPCTWIWRDSLGEATAVPADIEQYVLANHPSSAAIFHVSGDKLGIDEGRIAAETFAGIPVRVVANAAVPATGDVGPVVRRALRAHPAVVFIGASFGQRAADVMTAARAAGFTGTFLGGNTLNSATTARLAGTAGSGARSGAAWYAGNDFPANQSFITAYRQTYSQAPDQFAAQAYVGVQIIADALERGHVATSTQPLAARRAALQRALRRVALMTPLGPFRFTATHDVSQIVWILSTTAAGGHNLVGFCDPGC